MTDQPAPDFAGFLRELRVKAQLTQEELAEAAGLSPRSVSDLERGIHRTAHKDTAGQLADALGLAGPSRALFVAAARGRGPAADVLAAGGGGPGAVLAAALSAHRSAAFDVHVLAGSGCGAAEVAGSGFAIVVAGEEAGERVDEVE